MDAAANAEFHCRAQGALMMLSIIIVNFRNPPLLRLALRSLARVVPDSVQTEVIVVDVASTPETQNIVRHDCAELFPNLQLVPFSQNIGYTRGVNEGLRAATGQYLLILNPDIIIVRGTLEAMVEHLRQNPSVGLIGPGLLHFDDSRQDSCFRFYTPLVVAARRLAIPFTGRMLRQFLMRDTALVGPTPVDWVMGSALMTSRAAVDAVGLMDEQFFLYFSEVDWAYRFWENGYTVVYLPTVQMYHYHQRQSKGRFGILDILSRQETRWHIADAFHYFRKHGLSGQRPTLHRPVQPALLHA